MIWIFLVVELAALVLLVWQARKVVRACRAAETADVLERLHIAMRSVFGPNRLAEFMASEFAAWYYALFSWRAGSADGPHRYSYHRRSAYGAVVGLMMAVLAVEGVALHMLVGSYSEVAAWALSAFNAYTMVLVLADYRASTLRPIVLDGAGLLLRVGIRWTARVPIASIVAAESAPANVSARPTGYLSARPTGYLSAVLVGNPSLLLTLAEPCSARGLFGMRRQFVVAGLAPDDVAAFERDLRSRMTPQAQANEAA